MFSSVEITKDVSANRNFSVYENCTATNSYAYFTKQTNNNNNDDKKKMKTQKEKKETEQWQRHSTDHNPIAKHVNAIKSAFCYK